MARSPNSPGEQRPGPQGTTLFEAAELDEVISSPSADREGNVDRAALIGIKAPFLDQRFTLREGKTTIGRSRENDIILPDASVSARHAWILHDEGSFRLMNILSTNGTYLNDHKTHEATLQPGDRLRFGRTEFVFKPGLAPPPSINRRAGVGTAVWVGAGLLLIGFASVLLLR